MARDGAHTHTYTDTIIGVVSPAPIPPTINRATHSYVESYSHFNTLIGSVSAAHTWNKYTKPLFECEMIRCYSGNEPNNNQNLTVSHIFGRHTRAALRARRANLATSLLLLVFVVDILGANVCSCTCVRACTAARLCACLTAMPV